MSAEIFRGRADGWQTLGLRSAALELEIVPELGARVVTLRSRRTGRNWCWRLPRSPWLWASAPGTNYAESPQAGFEECFPTVGPCTVGDIQWSDHGDIWNLPWDTSVVAGAAPALRSRVTLPEKELVLERAIEVADASVRLSYAVAYSGTKPRPWMWSWHPLIAPVAGDRIELPDDASSLRIAGAKGADYLLPAGSRWTWPCPRPGLRWDMLELPDSRAGYAKAFAGPLRRGSAAVVNDRRNERLTFSWDALELPWLGLWVTRGGYENRHLFAIEPTNAGCDSLAEAMTTGVAPAPLLPDQPRHWSVALAIG